MRIAGAILAGGRGARMGGVQKGLFKCFFNRTNRTIIEHLTDEMHKSGLEEIFIVANDPAPLSELWHEIVPDIRPGNGPLGGIEAGLTYVHDNDLADAVLFIPCDMPSVSTHEISKLLESFRSSGDVVSGVCGTGGARQYPICCVVPVLKRREISAAIDNGHLKVARLWNELGAATTAFDNPKALCNINTPRDLELWQKEIG